MSNVDRRVIRNAARAAGTLPRKKGRKATASPRTFTVFRLDRDGDRRVFEWRPTQPWPMKKLARGRARRKVERAGRRASRQ